MTNKFQRNYKLVYTTPDAEVITIEYPLTVEFDINRTTFASANNANFKIHNLSPVTRAKIFQDKYNIYKYAFVDFYAGYGDQLSLLFTGKVMQAYSEKQGTEIITEIQALDNDIIQSYSSHTFSKGTSKQEVLKTLASDLPNVEIGAVGTVGNGTLSDRLVLDEYTFTAINKITGDSAFIDLNKLNILANNEVLKDVEIFKITSDTGLLGTPKRRDAQVEIDMIFEPRITVAQLLEIESSTASIFNGQFKVIGIHHSGVISGAVSGECKTTVNLYIGNLIPNSNQIFTEVAANETLSEVQGFKVSPISNTLLSSIKQVRDYLVEFEEPPETKITTGISWTNVLLNYSKQGGVPSIEVLTNLYTVSNQLQTFINTYYPGSKLLITSGWRSKTYNSTIPNAAPNSTHIQGKALDFYVIGKSQSEVFTKIYQNWNGWSYKGKGFIHVNLGNNKGIIANDV